MLRVPLHLPSSHGILLTQAEPLYMEQKKKVYVETSVVGYLTARPSHDVIKMARQLITRDWWETAAERYDLFISPAVVREVAKGDVEAAQKRIEVLRDIPRIPMDEKMGAIAERLLIDAAVPQTAFDDALHIAIAAVAEMDFLLSWNCRHIANAETRPLVRRSLERLGLRCPEICTPEELKGKSI